MDIVIDLSNFQSALETQNPILMTWAIFLYGGWLIFVGLFLWMIKYSWLLYIRTKYLKSIKFILLAIDIPKENEQTPKAVESIFATLAGTLSSINLIEKYIQGEFQLPFNFELISLEGYIQFIVRTPAKYRDLIEAAFYSQYPDAQITEVADYTLDQPKQFPHKEYDLFGTEFILKKADPYPIRTYPLFEHGLTQKLIDPMASLLEVLSRLRKGEQVWLQLTIRSQNDKWRESGEKIVRKLIGSKAEEKKNLAQKIAGITISPFLHETADILLKGANIQPGEAELQKKKNEMPSLMQYLSPGERIVVEAIQNKIAKIGFKTKIRFIYLAKKEVFDKARGVHPVVGAISQFTSLDVNGFKSSKRTKTKVNYFFVKRRVAWRQRRIMKAYRNRDFTVGPREFTLNTEELASIYHFPIMDVKAPLVKKVESKRVEPPFALPVEQEEATIKERMEVKKSLIRKQQEEELLAQVSAPEEEAEKAGQKPGGAPTNLPI